MKFTLQGQGSGYVIQRYDQEQIVIGDYRFSQSLALVVDQILDQGFPATVTALEEQHFERLLPLRPDLLLLGSGLQQYFPAPSLYRVLLHAGIGVEVMTTPAACRTYNLLQAEGRRVCALLLLGGEGERCELR